MLTDTREPMMTDKDRPDLSAADHAWLDRLTHDLVRRDELSTATAVRLSEQQREALLALRAEERAEGAEPTDVTELFSSPTDVAAQLAGETDDKEARAAQERQEAGVVAQVCSAMLLAGAYFVLIWPFKIILSSKEIHFGLEPKSPRPAAGQRRGPRAGGLCVCRDVERLVARVGMAGSPLRRGPRRCRLALRGLGPRGPLSPRPPRQL